MSVEAVAKLLRAVERSLADVPRNDYEANNRYLFNLERLADARQQLSCFSGDKIDEMHGKLEALAEKNEERKLQMSAKPTTGGGVGSASPAAVPNAFSLDLIDAEGGEEDALAELAQAEEALAQASKKKKDKKASKADRAKSGHREKKSGRDVEGVGEGNDTGVHPDNHGALTPHAERAKAESAQVDGGLAVEEGVGGDACVQASALQRETEQPSDRVPVEVVGATGVCARVADTALATVAFPSVVLDCEGTPSYCQVEMYRCVLLTLAHTTLSSAATGGVDGSLTDVPREPPAGEMGGTDQQAGNGENPDEDEEEEDDGEAAEPEGNGDSAHLQQLSQELILQFEEAQAEKEDEEAQTSFPAELPARLTPLLRRATYLPWVVLTCMGGYFAGGVFLNGRCVKHKSFQRYVVRKKQGGRQSTNAAGGGRSYGSIGSQIRAAQETKWKLEVRDLLLAWRKDIDAAAFIVYSAPGPQNRLMLTDFSTLPPPLGSSKRLNSPISIQDPRVRKVPMTTHRPTFAEVQRIYEAMSRFTLSYLPIP